MNKLKVIIEYENKLGTQIQEGSVWFSNGECSKEDAVSSAKALASVLARRIEE